MLSSPVRFLARSGPAGLPGARRVIRGGLARLFGPPPFEPGAYLGDPGLYGTGSASWRVIAEPAAIVGGVRGLLVQLLHPLAMAGVADHSSFRTDPLGRLFRTSAYVSASTYGATPEVFAAVRRVREIHRVVRGTAPDGRPYHAGDPHLLAWVSVALTSSFLATDRAFAPRPVSPAIADSFVLEQSRAAALLDERVDLDAMQGDAEAVTALRAGHLPLPLLDDGTLPRTVAELQARLDDYRDELEVGEQAREALRFLRWPAIPVAARAGYLPLLAGAIATLEPWQRALIGLPATDLVGAPLRAQALVAVTGLRLLAGPSPARDAAARRATLAADRRP